MKQQNIYLASSWRNIHQKEFVELLRNLGHDVYDFKEENGFNWKDINNDYKNWTVNEYRNALKHPLAQAGYENDINALKQCTMCVLLLPSGRSASWEFGYAMGQNKPGVVIQLDKVEPELMYMEADILTSVAEVINYFTIGTNVYEPK